MIEQQDKSEVRELQQIQKGVYLLEDLARHGLITNDDLDNFKKELNDKTHKAIEKFINSFPTAQTK